MFDRFTERARRVMTLARQEAQALNNDYIGTEHLLIALVHEDGGIAADALKNLGLDQRRVRAEVERIVEKGDTKASGKQLPFTPRMKRILEWALEESHGLGHGHIGTEHLLLGIISERDGPAANVLENLGVRTEDIRQAVLEFLGLEDSSRVRAVPEDQPRVSNPESRFDRFTERARSVMTLAAKGAQKLNNDYIGTEHILLGLVQEGSGVASQVLKNLDVDLRKVRAEVERLVEHGTSPVSASQLPFTPRAKRVLEVAVEESRNLGHNYVGTEHLLLGLIMERDGPAAHVLGNLGVKPALVRAEVVELLGSATLGEQRPPGVLHSGVSFESDSEEPGSPLQAQADLFEVEVNRALEERFPVGGITAGADYRQTSLGEGFHLVLHWRRSPDTPPLASLSVVASRVETLREKLPEILDLLADMVVKELRRGHGETPGA